MTSLQVGHTSNQSSEFDQALALCRAIFRNSQEAIAVLDANGVYVEQNAPHQRLLGYSDDQLEGKTPSIHLGDEQFERLLAELTANGSCRRDCVSRVASGDIRNIDLTAFAVRSRTGEPICFVGIKRDITDDRRAAEELQQSFTELQAVYRMAETVTRATDLHSIYDAALDELLHTVKADRASILLFDQDGVMRFKAWRGLSDRYRKAVEGHSPWSPDETNPTSILVTDVLADEELSSYRSTFEDEGLRGLGFIPLCDSGKLLGKFMLYFNQPRELQPVALRLAETIARHIAFAITRTRNEVALRESEERHRLLADVTARLNASLEFDEILQALMQLTVPAIADWCLIDLTDDAGGFERIAVASADPDGDEIGKLMRRRYAPLPGAVRGVTRVSLTGKPELERNVTDDVLCSMARSPEHLAALRAMRMNSWACAPMISRGRTLGVLTLVTGLSGRRYDERDLSLIVEIGQRAAVAFDNARLYREAQEANRAKAQFLATMSHELRTPLNAIGGYTELLQLGIRGPLTDVQLDDLARIQRSQRHLLGLINDLLHFARVESGHIELQIEPVAVDEVVDAVLSLMAPQIASKQLTVTRSAESPGLMCLGDRDKLRQVVLNLVSNAVKFTPASGSVHVEWRCTQSWIQISVSDSGPGIPAEKRDVIFEPFVQLGQPAARVADGAGLGLAISRELARAMHGDVTVTCEAGSGARFTCSIPAYAA